MTSARFVLATLLSGLTVSASATPPLTEPGSLVFSCAGNGNGNAYNGIAQESSFYAGEYQCRERFDPLGGKLTAKASYLGPSGGSSSSRGQAKWGAIKGQDDSNTASGEMGRSIAGFNDRWTLSSDSQIGTYGYVTVAVKVVGHIEAHGPSGAAALNARLYRDGSAATNASWSVETDIWGPDASLDINEIRELTFQVNFGSPFVLSTILTAQSGARAAGGVAHGLTRATQPGLIWQGIVRVTDQFNHPLTDWHLISASGIDWRLPCPCTPP